MRYRLKDLGAPDIIRINSNKVKVEFTVVDKYTATVVIEKALTSKEQEELRKFGFEVEEC